MKETPSAVSLSALFSLSLSLALRFHHAIVEVANVRNFEGGFEFLEMCEKEEEEEDESLLKKMRRGGASQFVLPQGKVGLFAI